MREPVESNGRGVWSCSIVTLPTNLGAVIGELFSARLKMDKEAIHGAGLVIEGYTL